METMEARNNVEPRQALLRIVRRKTKRSKVLESVVPETEPETR
jgi:hypothetical protein